MQSLSTTFFDLIDRIKRTTTIAGAWDCYLDAARTLGLPYGIACFYRSDRNFGETTFAGTVPDEWMRNYLAKGYQEVDPIVRRIQQDERPFAWALHDWDGMLDERQRAWQRDNDQAGIKDGMVIPDRRTREMRVIALCGHAGRLSDHDFKSLQYAGYEMLTHMEDLGLPTAMALPVGLSQREKECLRWVAAGKSDRDISTILSISDKTVGTHVDRAKHKLGVTSRAQAIVQAMRLGYLG